MGPPQLRLVHGVSANNGFPLARFGCSPSDDPGFLKTDDEEERRVLHTILRADGGRRESLAFEVVWNGNLVMPRRSQGALGPRVVVAKTNTGPLWSINQYYYKIRYTV